MKRYEPLKIEAKWQGIWAHEKPFAAHDGARERKMYVAEMFPYPSGAGLHVGHVRNFTIVDVLARFYRQQGFNVLRPIGWDTFGLPAENYALKMHISPKAITATNIANFKQQYHRLGMAVDWTREINTSDPAYYHWTQWIFTQLYKAGLAYQSESYQWWCDTDKTVLANEQVEGGKCWRCGNEVEKRKMKQWFFKITAYADELLDGLDDIDWPERIKRMQRNWIGRSSGARIGFKVNDSKQIINVFTTRPDTLAGATFVVLAPENKLAQLIATPDQTDAVQKYITTALKKSEVERQENKEKTGVFTGRYTTNPITGASMPIWVADYVLGGYGEGAVMAVPAHDERDNEFAKKFKLSSVKVIQQDACAQDTDCYSGEGILINSADFNGLTTADARERIIAWLKEKRIGEAKVTYKMRDWLISRQRYWGCPIPIINCPHCGTVPVPEKDLPVLLPEVEQIEPSGDGRSPLANELDWVNTICPQCGGKAERETDTMDGYACSSWYLLRYCDAHNDKQAWDKKLTDYWYPLDYYVGGDHAVAHLLYVRFWAKFLADRGLIGTREPIKRLLYNGYINAPDGHKMSKSKGNVIDPLDVIDSGYGADTLRVYEMFIGPYNLDAAWSTSSIGGVYRFINRAWNLVQSYQDDKKQAVLDDATRQQLLKLQHSTAKRVTEDIMNAQFNTAVAAIMEYLNGLSKLRNTGFDCTLWNDALTVLCQLLSPFAPHVSSEMLTILRGDDARLEKMDWPRWNDDYLTSDTISIAVQVNGKLRGSVSVAAGSRPEDVKSAALAVENVARFVGNTKPQRIIYVPNKIVNIVL